MTSQHEDRSHAPTVDSIPAMTPDALRQMDRERSRGRVTRRVLTWTAIAAGGAVIVAAGAFVTWQDQHGQPSAAAGPVLHPAQVSHQAATPGTPGAQATRPPSSPSASPPGPAPLPALACTDTTSGTAGSQCAVSSLAAEPSDIGLSADGSLGINSLTWSGWGNPEATGSGIAFQNNCQPACYDSTSYTHTAVSVTLSDPVLFNGTYVYNTMTVSGLPPEPENPGAGYYTGLAP